MAENSKPKKSLPTSNRAKAAAKKVADPQEPKLRDEPPTQEELEAAQGPAKTEAAEQTADEPEGADGDLEEDELEEDEFNEPTPDSPEAITEPGEPEGDDEGGDLAGLPDLDDGDAPNPQAQAPAAPEAAPRPGNGVAGSVAKSGQVRVTRTFSKSGKLLEEGEDEEALTVRQFATQPAQVGILYNSTINLGDYESAKVGVTVTVPCYLEEIDAALDFATSKAEARMAAEVAAIRAARSGVKPEAPAASRDAAKPVDEPDDSDDDDSLGLGALPDLDEE